MSEQRVRGSCLCGAVSYEIKGNLGVFQYCHCSRCRKVSGSAHAANLFVARDDFSWTHGADQVGRYEPPETKHYATSFCRHCGSSMPWLEKTGQTYIVPAGSLDDDPGIRPSQNIYCASAAAWYTAAASLPQYDELPPRKG
ncbi:MAG: GFA family protein [Lysobacterales bacterium]|jgi:hypothetical protein